MSRRIILAAEAGAISAQAAAVADKPRTNFFNINFPLAFKPRRLACADNHGESEVKINIIDVNDSLPGICTNLKRYSIYSYVGI